MAGIIQRNMTEADEQEPIEGPGVDGSAQHEGAEGEAPEANDTSDIEKDPRTQAALKFALQALYKAGAAKAIAKQIAEAQDPIQTVANVVFQLVSIVEDRSKGSLDERMLTDVSQRILSEVIDIAEAAGHKFGPKDEAKIGEALTQRVIQEVQAKMKQGAQKQQPQQPQPQPPQPGPAAPPGPPQGIVQQQMGA